jgi:hypothetical protein
MGCDPAHTKTLERGGAMQKSSDYSCIPLCRRCHDFYHTFGREAEWAAVVGLDVLVIVQQFNREWFDLQAWKDKGGGGPIRT